MDEKVSVDRDTACVDFYSGVILVFTWHLLYLIVGGVFYFTSQTGMFDYLFSSVKCFLHCWKLKQNKLMFSMPRCPQPCVICSSIYCYFLSYWLIFFCCCCSGVSKCILCFVKDKSSIFLTRNNPPERFCLASGSNKSVAHGGLYPPSYL